MLDTLDVRLDIVAFSPPSLYRHDAHGGGVWPASVSCEASCAVHIVAVAAPHKIDGPLLVVVLDGHGHGDDGGAWGGELMLIDKGSWRRVGHLAPLPLPGGDRAARAPWRMGVAVLARLSRGAEAPRRFPQYSIAADVARLAAAPGAARTTSLGRVFDAAAAILGVRLEQQYEGQAAMELEALCETPRALVGGFLLANDVLDLAPLFRALLDAGLSAREGAESVSWNADRSARRLDRRRRAALGPNARRARRRLSDERGARGGAFATPARAGDRTPSGAKNSLQRRRPVARTGVSRARGERASLVEAKRCVLRYQPA